MAKKITITNPDNGKVYTLEFNRKTVSSLERQGFELEKLTTMPATMIPMLFNGAFLMHHDSVKNDTKERLFNGMNNKMKLVQMLAAMFTEAYNTLLEDGEEGDEGNTGWAVVE